ncbi:aminoglycoside phosphotransferase family protein [Solirubrobacter phytolaccae]|uniref:Aminoglycoside phosphotransferase family protein n=1 Tax=Solirubrobacter phytolaccae TaxID=1404360 RepID=A0A9X3NF91_9ACTN|nr:aminoglycoside phosphotransferase family protein [Solirubrobacter phytolaccae]MDA0183900.1 aminoglycoside phosphotransferase family protein [Solirubrobacter phytolaccae]
MGEVPTDRALVERLLAAQYPALRGEPVRAVRSTGTVNAIYRVGEEHYARLPRMPEWAAALRQECEWLPRLAAQLTLRVPEPVFLGEPDDGYPLPWAVFRWLEGEPYGEVDDELAAARALAGFVRELHAIPVSDGVPRGGRPPLREVDEITRAALETDVARAAWERALETPPWDGERVWAHNDLLRPNLLVRGGRLHAVIDWGSAGASDPALDLIPAWAVFDAPGRAAYRSALEVDDATWERARGYALHQAALIIPYYRETNPAFTALALRTVEQLIRA